MVYRDRLGLILEKKKKKKKGTKESVTSDDVEREMKQPMAYGRGNMGKREEKGRRKEGDIPQAWAQQLIWNG